MSRIVLTTLFSLVLATNAAALTHFVNSAADTDDGLCDAANCTLREAINASNSEGASLIGFSIGSGPATIALASALPDINVPLVLDGTTQPGYSGNPIIQINGVAGSHCLTVRSSNTTIRGLDLGTCEDGISVIANNVALTTLAFERNFIGTRLTTAPINRRAISLDTIGTGTIDGVNIGNATAAGRNLFSTFGFVADAVYIGGNTSNVTIAGNYFGLADDGTPLLTAARFISDLGIYASASSSNITVGGSAPGARNVFGSGGGTQINIKIDSHHTNLTIEGNYLGTDPTGTIARRATNFAIWFFGEGQGLIRNNIITAGNTAVSRGVTTTGAVTLRGNWINYKADGSGPFPSVPATGINDFSSVPGYTIGGPNPGDGNVITNYATGISVNSPAALVQGNLVGLDPTGATIAGSGTRGIQSSFARIEPGVFIRDNRVAGWGTGIDIGSEALVTIDGNYVGTDATGTIARPNTIGLQIANAAGRAIVANNVISGNSSHGVVLQTTTMPVTMTGNRIGVSASGVQLPNGGDGIRVTSGSALKSIGTLLGTPNTIAYNNGNGISITGGSATTIQGNSIHDNTGLAIDLGANGVTPNDPNDVDTGANDLQNTPVLASATTGGATTTIEGSFNSTPNTTFTFELYTNATADPLGFGEAETLLTRIFLTTDASGNTPIHVTVPAIPGGLAISATATNNTTNATSEMSNDVIVSAAVVQFSAAAVSVSESGASITLTVTRTGGAGTTTTVEYTSANATATAGSDYTSVSGTLTFGPADTSQTITIPIASDALDEPDESFTVTLANVLGGNLGSPATEEVTIADDDSSPSLSAGDTSVLETNSGTTTMTFDVTLSAPSGQQVTVDYTTVDATATSGSDYGARFGTLTFAPGETSRSVAVTVNGDTTAEADESVQLLLSNAANASIADGTATGTITNDDGDPAITIADAIAIEGNSGPSNATIVLTLSNPSSSTVTVDYATTGNTASSGSDFTPSAASISFAPGVITRTIAIPILGDTLVEGNENLFLELTNPSGATIADPQATVTIVDDDGSPALTVSDVAVSESAGTATIAVLLAPASAQTVTVDWAALAGTAVAGGDFTAPGGTLTFAPGQTAQTFDIAITSDNVTESTETFGVTLSTPSNATIAGGDATVTIIDDDPTPEITIGDVTIAEGTTASLTVTLSHARDSAVTVGYATSNGTAGLTDYSAASNTLTFAAGETTKTVNIPTTADTLQEPDETFFVDLSSASNAVITRPRATATITDDDGTPALLIGDATLSEGNGGTTTATFTVTLAGNAAQTITVDYATADGTANSGTDYAASTGTLLFAPGTTTRVISVPVAGDTLVESDETYFVNLSNAANATISDNQAVGTIVNDDVAAVVPDITIGDASVVEGNAGTATLTFDVTLSAATTATVTVDFASASGSALSGVDFGAVAGTLVFAPGSTSRNVTVAVVGDLAVEGNETLVLNLSNAVNAILTDPQATGSIVDDDVAAVVPSISITDASAPEGNTGTTALSFTVSLSAPTTNAVSVAYATTDGTAIAGSDYASSTGTLVFTPGTTSQTITVAIAGDTSVETDETLVVNLSAPVNATLLDSQGIGAILNDDTPEAVRMLSISNSTVTEGNSGTRTAVFDVTLDAPAASIVHVNYATEGGSATAGEDFTPVSGTLAFAAGVTSQKIAVGIIADTLVEKDESFTVRLSGALNANILDATGRGTIVNDDHAIAPVVTVADIELTEGEHSALFTLKLDAPATQETAVTYATEDESATAGDDYLGANGSVVFEPGETTRTIEVAIVDDPVVETDERFAIALSTGARATAVIHDDDGGVTAILAIGGAGPGNFGSFFRTVIQLHNATDQPSTGNLILRPMGGGEPRTFGYALEPHETRDISPALDITGFITGDLIGLTGASPRTSVTVFNDAGSAGRSGFNATFIPVAKAVTPGKHAVLIGPDDAHATRLNIGIRSLGSGATLTLTLRRANGDIAAGATRTLPPNVLLHVASTTLFDTATEDNDSIECAVSKGSAVFYASMVDNVTQDSSFIVGEPAP